MIHSSSRRIFVIVAQALLSCAVALPLNNVYVASLRAVAEAWEYEQQQSHRFDGPSYHPQILSRVHNCHPQPLYVEQGCQHREHDIYTETLIFR